MQPKYSTAVDWEKQVSDFLVDLIEHPECEVEICEELIRYIMFLVRQDRKSYKRATMRKFDAAMKLLSSVYEGRLKVDGGEDEQ